MWVKAYRLDALATESIEHGEADAVVVVSELGTLAARGDMRALLVRAAMHSARLGDRAALDAVRPLAASIESPALPAELAIVV